MASPRCDTSSRHSAADVTDRRLGWLLLAPALLLLGGLTVYPAIWVIWLSLQYRVPVFGIARWAGAAHYAFLTVDSRFWNAAGVTALFTVASVALESILGLAMALALRGQQRGRRVAVALLLLAWALPSVVTAKMFEWLYHPSGGLVNFLLGGRAVNWLGDPALALPSLVLADVWRTTPFVALLCYARLLRSEEHTSELQSHVNIVCRLLLEKKKQQRT